MLNYLGYKYLDLALASGKLLLQEINFREEVRSYMVKLYFIEMFDGF